MCSKYCILLEIRVCKKRCPLALREVGSQLFHVRGSHVVLSHTGVEQEHVIVKFVIMLEVGEIVLQST